MRALIRLLAARSGQLLVATAVGSARGFPPAPSTGTWACWKRSSWSSGDFLAGVVLYTGTQTLPFGPRMRAMPTAALWEL
jgi:hypothetical protein